MNCAECETKLGLLSGYKHPIKGKKHIVCGHCFEVVNAEVDKNREQVLIDTGVIDIQSDYLPILNMPDIISNGLEKWLR